VAAKCGAALVTLTDHMDCQDGLLNLQNTIVRQGVSNANVCGLNWGHFTSELLNIRGADIILAADCFYSSKGEYLSRVSNTW